MVFVAMMPEVGGRFTLDTALALENVGGNSDLKFVEPGDTLLSCCTELEKGLTIPFVAEIRDSRSLSDRDTGAAQENVGGRSDLKFVELGDTLPSYCSPAVELETGLVMLLVANTRDAGAAHEDVSG